MLQRAILYRHERILLGREDCKPGPKKTIYIYMYILCVCVVFWGCINSFGLASFVVSDMGVLLLWIAAGPPRKSICERLSWTKVTGMHGNVMEFMIRGRLTRMLDFQSPGVRADAQSFKLILFEELASERNTIQA